MATIVECATYPLAFVGLVVLLVTVHEFGHWYAARTLGIEATEFSVGLGRVLLERTDRSGCAWRLRLWPVGGFVRFRGDGDAASVRVSRRLLASSEGMTASDRRRHFALRSPGDKAFVLAAGPAANLLLGFALASSIYVCEGRPYSPPVVTAVEPGSPAAAAGIAGGDVLVSVDGIRIGRFSDLSDEVSARPGGSVDLVVRTPGGPERAMTLRARAGIADTFGTEVRVGRIGVAGAPVEFRRTGVFRAMADGLSDVRKVAASVVRNTWQVVAGERSVSEMGGPVRIAEMSGNAARQGLVALVVWAAVLSVNLGVVNLVPIPVLDGGGLVICAVEWVTRRRASDAVMLLMNRAGVCFLFAFVSIVTGNDLMAFFGMLRP